MANANEKQPDDVDVLAAHLTLDELTTATNAIRAELGLLQARLLAHKAAYHRKAAAFDMRRLSPAEVEQRLLAQSRAD